MNILGFVKVTRDLTEKKIAEDELKESSRKLEEKNQELEKSNNELEQFAYVASHDLQEPLRKIRTYAGMLQENLKASADAASLDTLQKVISSARRMSTLIEDLLNFSRISESEKIVEPTDLNKIIQHVINDCELIIGQKKASIQADELPVIEAEPLRMNQLFYNLLNNSLKFSQKNLPPVIAIKCRQLRHEESAKRKNLDPNLVYFEISISDNGIGFNQQYAEHIFGAFKRLQNKADYPGSGIGLALCRKIALNHHGDIYAEGTEYKGSVFHVILPARQPQV
jgi:two-component system CheB/CheR fusion protein